jgi:hypothetical protein
MADEELDAGLVERVQRALCVRDMDRMALMHYEDQARAALLSLLIPVSALNALARGDAVVVPKVQTREICNAKQEVHGFSPMSDEAWARVQFAGIDQELWSAMLAASPYAAPLPAPPGSDPNDPR